MRWPLFPIFFLVIGFGCSSEKTQEFALVKPKIKSVTILTKNYPLWYWEEIADEIEGKDTLYLKEYYEYDSLGNLVAEKVREGDIRLNLFYDNHYDKNGLLVSRKWSAVEHFRSSSLDTFIYNDGGQVIEEVTLDRNGDTTENFKYRYNTEGQKVAKFSTRRYGPYYKYEYQNGKLTRQSGNYSATTSQYNELGQLTKEYLQFSSGDTTRIRSFSYDSLGQNVQIVTYDPGAKSTRVDHFVYNSFGDIEIKVENGDTLKYVYVYYDSN